MFNNITQPFSKPSFICSTILTDNPNIRPNSQTLYDLELRNRFSICRKNLLIFLRNTSGKNEIKVNFKIIEKYYKLPFESFPETTEISQILEKIIQRISINKSQQKNWYQEDIMLLTWLIVKYSYLKLTDIKLLKEQDWKLIADIIPFKTGDQCKFKWLSLESLNLQEKPWTIEEDTILKSLVLENPNKKWTEIAKNLFAKTGEVVYRPGKFCRERWNNYLTPDLKKGTWLIKEDLDLIEKVIKIGKKWSEISRITPGRTENGVKNRFNSLVKKLIKRKKYSNNKEDEAIASELHKELLQSVEKSDQQENKKSDNDSSIQNLKSLCSSKKLINIEELKKKQEFNLLFELLKSDINNMKGIQQTLYKNQNLNILLEHKNSDLSVNEPKLNYKKKVHREETINNPNETMNNDATRVTNKSQTKQESEVKNYEKNEVKIEPKEDEHKKTNEIFPEPKKEEIEKKFNIKKEEKEANNAMGINLEALTNTFGVSNGFNSLLMQQYMMNMMLQQVYTKTFISNLLKYEGC